jgi:alpha-L-arabinofuranosidase
MFRYFRFYAAMPLPFLSFFWGAAVALSTSLAAADLTVHADKPGATVSPTLYGAFFEDINRAGDGGIYAELIENRSFEDNPAAPIGWTSLENSGGKFSVTLDKSKPLNARNPTSLKIQIDATGGHRVGIFNQGFKGIRAGKSVDTSAEWLKKFSEAQLRPENGLAIESGKTYQLSLYARAEGIRSDGLHGIAEGLTASLETQQGDILAEEKISSLGSEWKRYELTLIPRKSETNARLVLAVTQPGTLWLDMVSLFPSDTYKGRSGGLRPDMIGMMEKMHPGLLRFPGGSFSEGAYLSDAWKWKETLGDVAQRPGGWNIWGYRSTHGLGFHEYLQLAEDLGAEPLFVAHVGMAEKGFVPLDQLEPWIADTLDAIEYANGPVSSKWGALRAKNGHPAPFNLKYVEIGNENGMGYSWGGGTRADYLPRYKAFNERIKATHPEIMTIANIHTEPDASADLVDEHYYNPSEWFFKAAHQYDKYDRHKPKLYLGEYACQNDAGNGNMLAALAEAAFLTGLERNADVVSMSSYAPFFNNPYWQGWRPNAVLFDPTRVYGTPSYHVQTLFGSNRPDVVLPVELPASPPPIPTLFAAAGLRKDSGDLILKVVNSSAHPETLQVKIPGMNSTYSTGTRSELSATSLTEENSFKEPGKIAPKTSALAAYQQGETFSFPPYSVTVLRWKK